MSYDYENQRAELFTDHGQRVFLAVRDNVQRLLQAAGAFRGYKAWEGRVPTSDSWTLLACLDRLVELGELTEVPDGYESAQHKIFTGTRS